MLPCSASELRVVEQYKADPDQDKEMHVDYLPVIFRLEELQCLSPMCWLNSQTINSYLAIVQRKVRSGRVHIGNSFFMSKVLSDSRNAKTWVKGVCKSNKCSSMYDLHRLCFPYNIRQLHWVAVCCDFLSLTITLIDSLPGRDHDSALQQLKNFLESTLCTTGVGRGSQPVWNVQVRDDKAFRQENSYDCGLFTIGHVTLCALKQENRLGTVTQESVTHMRERVYHDLVMNEIKFEVYGYTHGDGYTHHGDSTTGSSGNSGGVDGSGGSRGVGGDGGCGCGGGGGGRKWTR